jgi:diacylglycerol O-acyltransferase
VLLSCVAGAIGDYLRAGRDPAGKEIRAMVPVNLRPLEKAWQLGNRFGLAPLVLPIGIDNPVERVYAVRQRMSRAEGQLPAAAGLRRAGADRAVDQAGAGRHAGPVRQEGHRGDDQRAGARQPLKFCGATLRQTHVLGAGLGRRRRGREHPRYAGGVQFGLITDAALCPEPQRIIDRFAPEFEQAAAG